MKTSSQADQLSNQIMDALRELLGYDPDAVESEEALVQDLLRNYPEQRSVAEFDDVLDSAVHRIVADAWVDSQNSSGKS
jgi:hypothetical protein